MKRIALFILIAAISLCAFVSCNIDATEGIYSEVASSTITTDVNIKAYLGQYNNEYYYLSDEGIFKIGSGCLLANSPESIIRSVSLDETTGAALVLSQKSNRTSELAYYSAFDAAPVTVSGSFLGLLNNGLAYDGNNIYTVSGSTATPVLSDVSVRYSLETNNYAFFSVKKGDDIKYYVVKNDGTVVIDGIDGSTKTFIAFQPIGASATEFVLVIYNSSNATFDAYKLTSTGVEDTKLFTMKSSLEYAYSSQAASFYYEEGANKYIVIKASNYFDRYNLTDGTIESISSGFATTLRTADVVNIKSTADSQVFIAGTYESMLYKIDMNNNSSTQIR